MAMFDFQRQLLMYSGFLKNPSSNRVKLLLQSYIIYNYVLTFVLILTEVYYANQLNSVLEIAETLAPSFTAVNNIVRCTALYVYKVKHFDLMEELERLNEKWSKTTCFKEIITKASKKANKISKIQFYACLFTGSIFIIKPLLKDAVRYWIFKTNPTRDLILKADFYFDSKNFPGYEFAIFLQATHTYFLSSISGVCGTLFCCYCLNIAAHFKNLRKIIKHEKIDGFVTYHTQIIHITKEIIKVFKPIILVQFVFVGIVTCVTGLQVIMYNDFGKKIAAFFHGFASFSSIALQAYGAQKVMDSAESISMEAYEMHRNYLPIIIMSQKELKFDTGFFDASFRTLSLVLSRTMSLLTLLKSFID